MKRLHAVALALVGWYLVVPPPNRMRDPQTISFRSWRIQESFDTAADCEKARKETISNAGPSAEQYLLQKYQISPKLKKVNKPPDTDNLFATCVATDDPRLAK